MRRKTAALLLLAVLALPVAACGGGEEAAPTAEEVEGTPTEAQETGTQEGTQEGSPGGADEGDPQAGKPVFASAGCGGCHVFEAANATGTTGPNLDESDADYAAAVEQIRNGGGGMPPFKDQLSEKQIKDVASFVVAERGGGG